MEIEDSKMSEEVISEQKIDSPLDSIIGALETLIVSSKFSNDIKMFFDRYVEVFDENISSPTPAYGNIFNEFKNLYQSIILQSVQSVCSMPFNDLAKLILTHEQEVSQDLIDLFSSLTDVNQFIQDMIQYKCHHDLFISGISYK